MQLLPPFLCDLSFLHTLSRRLRTGAPSEASERKSLPRRMIEVFMRTWHLGFTSFGGLGANLQALHAKFVEENEGRERWIDEQTELSAICQALPRPASTKLLFCISLLHAGFIPAVFAFVVWCLPDAIGMYALAVGVQSIDESLPEPVHALAQKAIHDRLTRLLVVFGACFGLCYDALWYFPILMIAGGLVNVLWDGWLNQVLCRSKTRWRQRNALTEYLSQEPAAITVTFHEPGNGCIQTLSAHTEAVRPRKIGHPSETNLQSSPVPEGLSADGFRQNHIVRIRLGFFYVVVSWVRLMSTFPSFVGVILARGLIEQPPFTLDLFAAFYLAGTIIFGGGPVVIPLLRSYVVDPGWVSSRDFLIGLAIIQAFPGPNFNIAVFLGSLAAATSRTRSIIGAFLGLIGIFLPGITLAVSVQSFWRVLRKRKCVADLLRGINATAVGLFLTAVYRLWEVGFLTPDNSKGESLAKEPWWVVVATIAYAGNAWFKVPAAFAIISGAVLGLCWYAVVGRV
ncbi:chromate transporter-domain-containing protein [Aspergillus crustosus]